MSNQVTCKTPQLSDDYKPRILTKEFEVYESRVERRESKDFLRKKNID